MTVSNKIEAGQNPEGDQDTSLPQHLEIVKYHWTIVQTIFTQIIQEFGNKESFLTYIRNLGPEDVRGLQENLQKKLIKQPNNKKALLVYALVGNILAAAEQTTVINNMLPYARSVEYNTNQQGFPKRFLKALIGIDILIASFNVQTGLKSPFENIGAGLD